MEKFVLIILEQVLLMEIDLVYQKQYSFQKRTIQERNPGITSGISNVLPSIILPQICI